MAGEQFFICGTDTDVGKTLVATGILAAANTKGMATVGLKPVAAGCEETDQGLRNQDALLLQQTMSLKLPYEQINPIALAEPMAPHLAAAKAGRRLKVSQLAGYCRGALTQRSDFAVVEGAGGWRVPLNHNETLADLAIEMSLPVILVVGVKLGCINHALLTVEAIRNDGLALAGWVANQIDESMLCYEENLETLKAMIPAPCLGVVPYLTAPTAEAVSAFLDIDLVINS